MPTLTDILNRLDKSYYLEDHISLGFVHWDTVFPLQNIVTVFSNNTIVVSIYVSTKGTLLFHIKNSPDNQPFQEQNKHVCDLKPVFKYKPMTYHKNPLLVLVPVKGTYLGDHSRYHDDK